MKMRMFLKVVLLVFVVVIVQGRLQTLEDADYSKIDYDGKPFVREITLKCTSPNVIQENAVFSVIDAHYDTKDRVMAAYVAGLDFQAGSSSATVKVFISPAILRNHLSTVQKLNKMVYELDDVCTQGSKKIVKNVNEEEINAMPRFKKFL
uniref:Uncharacterized protein n=1 Tax=Panagrolaimus sp. JU765 TaxID=591449 RepID=A0AC34Q9H1_9BILA